MDITCWLLRDRNWGETFFGGLDIPSVHSGGAVCDLDTSKKVRSRGRHQVDHRSWLMASSLMSVMKVGIRT